MPLYQLAVLGAPTEEQLQDLRNCLEFALKPFELRLEHEVEWNVLPTAFEPSQHHASAVAFYGGSEAPLGNIVELLLDGIPILPVASKESRIVQEIPDMLRKLNCLSYETGGPQRTATALLECLGLLPRQRRVFLSYRRDEAREAAAQLFDEITSRQFDVFLDTRNIGPGEEFQSVLWHRLCDSDVLVMLDTPHYFESRWTSAEFGRALAKGIAVLRIGWPDCTPSPRVQTASRADLLLDEIDAESGRLSDNAVARLCLQLEIVRSESVAVRRLNMVSSLRNAVEKIGGVLLGVGCNQSVFIQLAEGTEVIAFPTIGVPDSTALHAASVDAAGRSAAVVYDHIGIMHSHVEHLDWLGSHIPNVCWVKSTEAAWRLAGWQA